MSPVPPDGATIRGLMLRGNTVMMGYLKNPAATREAFAGGWFHTGDLAAMHPDGYPKFSTHQNKPRIISPLRVLRASCGTTSASYRVHTVSLWTPPGDASIPSAS